MLCQYFLHCLSRNRFILVCGESNCKDENFFKHQASCRYRVARIVGRFTKNADSWSTVVHEAPGKVHFTTNAPLYVNPYWHCYRMNGILPLLYKSQETVLKAVQALFPFPMLGLDSDIGGESINEVIATWCDGEQITFTRERPELKDVLSFGAMAICILSQPMR